MYIASMYPYYFKGNEGEALLGVTFDSTVVTLAATETKAGPGGSVTIGPRLLYDNGKSYLVYPFNGTSAEGANKTVILTYDERYGVGRPVGVRGRTGNYDVHHGPTIIKHDGHLYIAQEKNHNTDPIIILKNRTVDDNYIFELTAGEIGASPTYPKPFELSNGPLVNISQFNDTLVGYNINTTGDFEGDWGDTVQISQKAANEDEQYTVKILNGRAIPDKVVFVIGGRDDDATPYAWFRKYLVKMAVSADGSTVTFYNWDESFSKTSEITSAELITNFQYFYSGADTVTGHQPIPALDNDGNFYDITGNDEGGYDFIYQASGAASPTVKEITLPDTPTLLSGGDIGGNVQQGAAVLLVPISTSEVYAWFRVEHETYGRFFRYKTTDLGDTWTFEADEFPDADEDLFGLIIPDNFGEIENNKNSILVASAVTSPAALYIKRWAFGTIQSETGDPFDVTAYSEAEYIAEMEQVCLFIEAGKIANTGTALTGVTDQSAAARTITIAGSPTLDSGTTPTYATLDGVNDAISLATTGLTALSEGVVIIVGRRDGAAAPMFTASKSTVTDQFMHFGKSIDKTRFHDSPTEHFGKTTIANGFHIFAFVFQNGVCNVLHFLDGELQLRDVASPISSEGRFLNAYTGGFNQFHIGRLVRSSGTLWQNFDFKHLAISGTPPTYESLCRMMKYLSNKYSITLNSHFS